MKEPVPYQAYLIRLWPTVREGVSGYRVSLESVASGECKHFPDLESLFVFLEARQGEDRGSRWDDQEGGDVQGKIS